MYLPMQRLQKGYATYTNGLVCSPLKEEKEKQQQKPTAPYTAPGDRTQSQHVDKAGQQSRP